MVKAKRIAIRCSQKDCLPSSGRYYCKYRPGIYLFPSSYNKKTKRPLSYESIRTIYENTRKKAGVKKGNGIHTLRHSFATPPSGGWIDLRKIQVLMGHSRLTTTMIYLHVSRQTLSTIPSPLDLIDHKHAGKEDRNDDQIIKPDHKTPEVADILHLHLDDYKAEYPLWPEHYKIATNLLNCRTARLGGHIERCDNCGSCALRIIPAVTATVPNVSICHVKDGWKNAKTRSCRPATSMSSSPCRTS